MHERFMDQCLDLELEEALDHKADRWDLHELRDIKQICEEEIFSDGCGTT